jgi:hypothetical protein
MASPAIAGKSGKGKVRGGGGSCLAYDWSVEPGSTEGSYSALITVSISDQCNSSKRQGSDIEGGSATFSVRSGEEALCREQVDFENLERLVFSCDVEMTPDELSARMTICLEVDADLRDGRYVSPLSSSQCQALDIG